MMNNRRLVIDPTPAGQLAAALARVAELELAYAEENRRHAEAEVKAANLAARVHELEAQLAAQWRPVTEMSGGTAGQYYLVAWDYDGDIDIATYYPPSRMWFSQNGGEIVSPTHYEPRPLPPAPQEPTP